MGVEIKFTDRDYFDVYLRFWEQYHFNLALGGLAAGRNRTIVVYGRDRLMACARGLGEQLGRLVEVEEFRVFERDRRHREWEAAAERAIRRVADVWQCFRLPFPLDQVMQGC